MPYFYTEMKSAYFAPKKKGQVTSSGFIEFVEFIGFVARHSIYDRLSSSLILYTCVDIKSRLP